jgi:lipoprotein-anchoring transpeptidase ErfK/SrfK
MDLNQPADAETEVFPVMGTSVPPVDIRTVPPVNIATASTSKHTAAKVIGIVVAIIALLAAALFCIGHFFFSQRAPMGTSFAGQSVAGKTTQELTQLVSSKVSKTTFVLGTKDGKSVEATYKDLGVTVDVDGTVDSLLGARGTNAFSKVVPWNGTDVALKATTDTTAMQTYLTKNLVDDDSQVVLPKVGYDAAKNTFTVTPGKDGQVVSSESTNKAVTASYTKPAGVNKVSVELTAKEAPISLETAIKAAASANERLSKKLVVSNGSAKTYTIPASEIGSWTKVEPNTDKGTMDVVYDADAIKVYLETTLPSKLQQKKVDQENLVTPAGVQLQIKTAGVDGVDVKDVSEAVTKVSDALANNQDVSAKVTTTVTKHGTKNVKVPSNFDKANGDPWVSVNLSKQTATAYRGTTVVKTFNVATGLNTAGRKSDNGTYYVYLKPRSQTMRGEGYVTPNVQWISYYNGGEGFHSAPWNTVNIANGNPTSHGCINMNPADAKWMYDFAVIGTKIEVVGTTPSGSVR